MQKEEKRSTLSKVKLVAGAAVLVALAVTLTLGLGSMFRHEEKPTN